VDAHLHVRPFVGPPIAFADLLADLHHGEVSFANLYGIDQRLPKESACIDPGDFPGVIVASSLKSDFSNAQNSLDADISGLQLVLMMTFPDLTKPTEIRPRMPIETIAAWKPFMA
jgi:hypothetical protein